MTIAALFVFGGLAIYAKYTAANRVPADELREPAGGKLAQSEPRQPKTVVVMKPRYEGNDLVFDKRQADRPSEQDKVVFAVNSFLDEAKITPAGAKLKACKVDKRLAILTFTPEFETTYGTEDEQTLVKGILTAVGQFQEIDKVQFMVEDHKLETLGGIELLEPQPVIR